MTAAEKRGGRLVAHPAGQRGTLTTASGHALPVSTFDRGGDVVLVAIPDAGGALAAEAPDEATLEYVSARGMIRLHGDAVLEHPSLIRFHAEGDPELVQRRRFVRVTTPQRVTLDPSPDAVGPAHTVDLSGGGMLLHGAPALAPGDQIGFEIRLGSEPTPIVGVARVVRADEHGRRALAFERIGETDRETLIRFVFACLRVAQAKTCQ